MTKTIALCLDEDSFKHPECIGLKGESLEKQEWLAVFDCGIKARSALKDSQDFREVWVISCNDLEPINLAASLKHDRPERAVKLVTLSAGGSFRSRANNANIDEVLELSAFVRLYGEVKQKAHGLHEARRIVQLQDLPNPVVSECADVAEAPQVSTEDDSSLHTSENVAPSDPLSEMNQRQNAQSIQIAKPKQRGFLLSVMSGSGGCGKSSVSVLAALESARKGYRTLLVDSDLQFGDIAHLLRNLPITEIVRVIDNSTERRQVFEQEAPLVVLGAPELFEASERIADSMANLMDEALQYFDVVIANTGSNWSEQHAFLLEKSSAALFLIDQRSSSLRACKHALELCARCGIAFIPFKFAVNRCTKNRPFSAQEIASVLQSSNVFELKDGGDEVEEFLASGNALELYERNNDFAMSVEHMMMQLLPAVSSSQVQVPTFSDSRPSKKKHVLRIGGKRNRVAL